MEYFTLFGFFQNTRVFVTLNIEQTCNRWDTIKTTILMVIDYAAIFYRTSLTDVLLCFSSPVKRDNSMELETRPSRYLLGKKVVLCQRRVKRPPINFQKSIFYQDHPQHAPEKYRVLAILSDYGISCFRWNIITGNWALSWAIPWFSVWNMQILLLVPGTIPARMSTKFAAIYVYEIYAICYRFVLEKLSACDGRMGGFCKWH